MHSVRHKAQGVSWQSDNHVHTSEQRKQGVSDRDTIGIKALKSHTRSGATGLFSANDSRAVTMVQPALGPSLGVAPCGVRGMKRGMRMRVRRWKLHDAA